MTIDEIVSLYIRAYRKKASQEMCFFKNQPNLNAAIRQAALCKRSDGKRHSHQRRIPKPVLENAEQLLQLLAKNIAQATDFDTLHRLIKGEIGPIAGVGALTVYDIAHRIGAFLRKEPTRIYLHAGTKVGAAKLGLRGESLDPARLPKPFSRLTPAEIEDCLCIYKRELAGEYLGTRILQRSNHSRVSHHPTL